MDRNSGSSRYTYVRRHGQNHQSQNQSREPPHSHQQSPNNSSLSSSSTSSSSVSSNSNNNQQHLDNHRNSNASSSSSNASSSQFSSLSGGSSNPNATGAGASTSFVAQREPMTQHDELIRYINEAWTKVSEHGQPVIYCTESDHLLKNFKPFDLEEYWGQRLVQNIQVSGGHQ